MIQLLIKLTYIGKLNWLDGAGNYSKLNYKIIIKDTILLIVIKLIFPFKLYAFCENYIGTWDKSKEIFNYFNDYFTNTVVQQKHVL